MSFGTIFTGADSILIVCAGAVSDALAIRNSMSFLLMLALPPSAPFFFLPDAWTPKVAKVPVKTEAMKVGSILSPLSSLVF